MTLPVVSARSLSLYNYIYNSVTIILSSGPAALAAAALEEISGWTKYWTSVRHFWQSHNYSIKTCENNRQARLEMLLHKKKIHNHTSLLVSII